ncbi:MAG: hypothetical protein RRY20_06380 [Bilophila sp.]
MTSRSTDSPSPRNPRDFNDPRNKPRDDARPDGNRSDRPGDRPSRDRFGGQGARPERSERPDKPDWASRGARPDRGERPDRGARPDRGDRPDRGARPDRGDRPARPDWAARSDRPDRGPRPDRGERPGRFERTEGGERLPRPPRGSGLIAELKELDHDLIRMIAKRSRMLTRLPDTGASDHERELRTSWEGNATSVSRDPRLIRQLFALLQEVEVAPADMDQPASFNLAPAQKPVHVDLPAPTSDRLPRLHMVLAAGAGSTHTLENVVLSAPVIECLKGLNQIGASLRWEEDGRILCQGGEPITGHTKSILDKVVHVGDDAFNLYLVLFQMVTRPARLKIIGESGLKFVDLVPLRHFLPLLGARLTSVVPGQEGLPARLESSAMLPSEVDVPAELPADAAVALLMAAPGWERELTVRFDDHPAGKAIVAEVFPVLQAAGIAVTRHENGDSLSLHIVPGTATLEAHPQSGVNIPIAATLLAMPAFVGGTVCLHGAWDNTGDDATTAAVRTLLSSVGITLEQTKGALVASLPSAPATGATEASEATGDAAAPALAITPLTDLSKLSPALFPLGLALSLIPLARAKGGAMPTLPEGADMVLVDSFLNQIGLAREEALLTPTEPLAAPWASPTMHWALALSLVAFLRPNIKLSNPGIVLAQYPQYWNLYNGLPSPSLNRKTAEANTADVTPERPAPRRRVLAGFMPESEMPDEIVYPEED